jgi:hypothetical protein
MRGKGHLPVRRRLQTIRAIAPSIIVTTSLAIAGLCAVRACVPAATLHESNDVVGNYLQTVGTIYAVLLAFVVYVVWGQFNDARLVVEREANEIVDLFRTAKGFPAGPRQHVQDHLRRYADEVVRAEWHAMAVNDEACIARTSRILDGTWDALEEFEAANVCHHSLFEEALSRFNDLSDLRTERLVSSRQRIPFAMRLLMYMGAIILIGSMWLFEVRSFAIHALITGAMAGALSHVLYIVADLDDTFSGDWQVSPAAFERARAYMEETNAAPPG